MSHPRATGSPLRANMPPLLGLIMLNASILRPVTCSERILSDSAVGRCLLGEMKLLSDAQLLEQYARQSSEAAFGEIVARYAALV